MAKCESSDWAVQCLDIFLRGFGKKYIFEYRNELVHSKFLLLLLKMPDGQRVFSSVCFEPLYNMIYYSFKYNMV